jgi:hypothetical protein
MIKMLTTVYEKLMAYSHAAVDYSGEVGGFGFVDIVENDIVITDIVLVEQESDVGSADLTDGLLKLMPTLSDEQKRRLRVFWHSHGSMSKFWSAADAEAIAALVNCYDWFVSIEANTMDGKVIGRLDTNKPIPMRLDTAVVVVPSQEILDKAFEEVKEKVTVAIPSVKYFTGHGWTNNIEGGRTVSYRMPDGSRYVTKDEPIDSTFNSRGEIDNDEFEESHLLSPWSDA